MIGPRVGVRVGPKVGLAVGVGNDQIASNGYAFVGTGPGLVFISGSSNGQGIGVAASMTDYPGIATAYSGFQLSRMGASLAGAGGGTWVSEAKQDLQPRTANISGYAVGTCGGELKMGRDLDAANAGLWGGATFTTDGALLHSTQHFLNPAWPTAGGQWVTRLFSAIDAAIVAHGKPLRVFVWMHGNDANDGPSSVNYYANLNTLFNLIRLRYGDIGIVIERMFNKNSAGSLMVVRSAMESFVMANSRARLVCTDECGARDTAHYSDDAGGVLGYCEVGKRVAVQVLSAANQTVNNNFPIWGAQGDPVTGGSGAGLTPPFPYYYGTYNNKPDIGVLWLSGSGVNAYATPAGWTQVTNSPQWGGSAADGRLQVWTKTLSPGETLPTIADVASDDAKIGGILIIRNSSGLDVAPAGSTVTAAAPASAVSFPSVTTVTNNCLIVHILAHRTDASPHQCAGYANAALTELTEQVDYDNTIGLGYGMVVCTGKLATAGATGNTTATLQSAVSQARLTLAFKP